MVIWGHISDSYDHWIFHGKKIVTFKKMKTYVT